MSSTFTSRALALVIPCLFAACGDSHNNQTIDAPGTQSLANTIFVARAGTLASFDIATGQERAGEVSPVTSPVDLQVIDDGTVMVNLTGSSEVLAVEPFTMLEKARIPSSGMGATRPVHSFITPKYDGKQYWAVMNDGTGANDSSASFIDITPGSSSYLQRVGEISLGLGHHKATFSKTKMRMVASNINDCNNVMSVYDFSDPAHIQTLATLTAQQAGWTAADPGSGNFNPKFCDPTYARGIPPAPHGCGTSVGSGKSYCTLTGDGDIVVIDLESDSPTFKIVPTGGSGAGFTHAQPAGRYVYTLQGSPREGNGGMPCQIGQIAVTDSMTDTIAAQLPIFYKGPTCTDALTGTDEETDDPGRFNFTDDGTTLFVEVEGGFDVATARSRYTVVVDTTDPAHPIQLPSIPIATHTGNSWGTLDGTGKHLFVVATADGKLTEIDTSTKMATRNIDVGAMPLTAGTYGTLEGPSEQTAPQE